MISSDNDQGRRVLLAALGAILLALVLAAPTPSLGQSADALRASGAAGERFDGYMEARDPAAAAAVEQINAQRREVYAKRAAEQGVPIDQVGRVFAGQIIAQAAAGTWLKTEGGQWVQK